MEILKIVKLSYDISEKDPIFTGNPKNKIELVNSLQKDGVETHMIHLFTHNGTHIDLPRHYIGGKDITSYPINRFIFNRVQITDYYNMKLENKKDLLLVRTSCKRHKKDYSYITTEMAEKISKYDYKCVGIDTLSIGSIKYKVEAKKTHSVLFKKGILILEDLDLRKLNRIPKRVFAIPLFVKGIEASPTTVFAEVENE